MHSRPLCIALALCVILAQVLHDALAQADAAGSWNFNRPRAGEHREFADVRNHLVLKTLSSPPDRISGGDVLARVIHPELHAPERLSIFLDGADITSRFQPDTTGTASIGLIDGLKLGKNTLNVTYGRKLHRAFTLINYPIKGPIISGPHLRPFICQTKSFMLPDGRPLGPALDADCSANPAVSYVYLSRESNELRPLTDLSRLPADVATTTITTGASLKFVVRVETATINRGIYQSAILHDPTTDPVPAPFRPLPGWNGVLIAMHGAGCAGGWYTQSGPQELVPQLLDTRRLGQGYALYTNTLQNPSVSCNPFLAGETAMMGKEYFIEKYGVPRLSLSMGVSGGAYTTLQIIDAFPGLYEGAIVGLTYPDALSIALSGMDAHLLRHYFTDINPVSFTEAQQVAVSGYHGMRAWHDAANQAGRADPVPSRMDVPGYLSAVWQDSVPVELRYDPEGNRRGARPTIWDIARNIYGVDPETGFARRVYDNVGVQYGLDAMEAGLIATAQFLDLNERIGGYNDDSDFIGTRTQGDPRAISEAYKSGLHLSGGGGLADVPILDLSAGLDETGGYHYQWFRFAVRERLVQANGDADNFVMWRGPAQSSEAIQEQGFEAMMKWIEAVHADRFGASAKDTLRRNKPPTLVDGCWTADRRFVPEPQSFDRLPRTRCNALWPSYAFPRYVAGSSVTSSALKCMLKPVDAGAYRARLKDDEVQRLRKIFPEGVCDWSLAGVSFERIDVGRSYGPAPPAVPRGELRLMHH